jgi:N6-adenosine-specific RNA methylase IME4
MSKPLKFHPLADIFPLIEGAEFDGLVADIKANGVREPIWIYEEKILDGRNRYRAAAVAGVACPTRLYEGDDPIGFVISMNLKRRHLDESQRAMVAAKLATLRSGDNQHSEGLPIGRSSELLNVSERSVARARDVQEGGAPELIQAVERGEVSVSAAADVATLSHAEQREILARCDPREIKRVAQSIKASERGQRLAKRMERIAAQSRADAGPLPQDRKYPIILADPAWRYEHDSYGVWTLDVEEHYATMSLEEICALPVAELATPNAMLFLWSPTPILEQAFSVIRAWGFEYRTAFVWIKQPTGTGLYLRQRHEHLLVARRGEFPTPVPANRPDSVIEAPRRGHSVKPDQAHELIERMYPDLPRIELFARQARPGWSRWGKEAPPSDTEAA